MDTKQLARSFEYIVVGAGGGTVAARLAEAGRTVLLLEAGGDPRRLAGGDELYPDEDRLPFDYDIPLFHHWAAENNALTWKYFVRHYEQEEFQRLDPKYLREWRDQEVEGVYYLEAALSGDAPQVVLSPSYARPILVGTTFLH